MSTHRIDQTPRRRGRLSSLIAIPLVLVLVGGTAWAYWIAGSTAGSSGASAATSVGVGSTPTASAAGSAVTVSWAASTLATGQAVSGYQVKRYDATTLALQTILTACTGTVTATTCVESAVPTGSWKYSITPVFATNWLGTESAKSATVLVDPTAPTNAISLVGVNGGASLTGTNIYYRGVAAGSFSLSNAVADAGSGPASSQTASLTGTTTGWAHSPSIVSTPVGGPYVSNAFTWGAATTSSPGEVVTGRDVAGNTTATSLTFVNDSTAPTAGTISYLDGYQAGRSVAVTFTSGTDAGSGITTRSLQRASAALTAGTCGTFGSFAAIGANNPTSIYTDTAVFNGACYKYQFVVTDAVGNQHIATTASVAKVDYAGAVNTTTGILSQWRLGEATTSLTASDSFTGTAGSLLTAHVSDTGSAWFRLAGAANALISDVGRVYRSTGFTLNYTNATPSSANYSVEADLVMKSATTGDMVGVIGRLDTATTSFYMARWEPSDQSWNLLKYTNGAGAYIAYVGTQGALTTNESYRLKLEMNGSTISLYVNGVLKVTGTDAAITAAGVAGIWDGADGASAAKSNTTGIHIENFQVTPSTYPRAADSKGTNTGDYKNGPTMGSAGALGGDANTATLFDGVNDYVQMTGTTGLPVGAAVRSTELWFKTSSSARQTLFAYGSPASAQQYGLWLDGGGLTMTAWGSNTGNDKVFTMPSALNNGSWHHVVQTYNGTAITLYIDGVALTPQNATRNTVIDGYGFAVGALLRSADMNYGGFFNGSIDEVSFYTTELSQATVTNHYQLGSSPAADLAGPTGGSVTATALVGTGAMYSTSTTINLTLAKGTDATGLAPTGAQLNRATATLTSAAGTANGVCGTFGGYTLIATDPASPRADVVTDQACYRYQYVVSDTLGNSTTYTSADIKVDATAPAAPTLSFSAFNNTYWAGTGTTVYYRSAAASGSFTATATSSDAASGIVSYTYPALGAGWTSTPGALGVNTYSWSSAPAAPGTPNVTATNNAGTVSPNSPFTLTADITAPTAGTVSYVNGSTGGTSVTVTTTTGTDAGSGLGTRTLQRATAVQTGLTCGTYGAFTTIATALVDIPSFSDTVVQGNCYKYQYLVADNVGNVHTATSTNVARTPWGAFYTFEAGSGTTAVDSFSNNNTATLQATAGWTAGKVGSWALNLTGATTSFASVPHPVIDSSQSYTVAAWVRPSANNTNHRTIASIDGASISPFYLQWVNSQFAFTTRGADSTAAAEFRSVTPVGAVTPGTWYHLVGVHDKVAQTITLYVNGVSQGSTAFTTPWKANGATAIGRGKWNGANADFAQGALDDVRFYDRPLSGAEIADLTGTYASAISTTSGLVSYWRLGEASAASTMDDIAAANNDGAYVNSPTTGVPGAIARVSNTAVQFDGVDDFATATRQISGDLSIEFWFKSTQNFANNFGLPACTAWWQGAGLIDADSGGAANDFGISLCSGKVIAGLGSPETNIVTPDTYNNGAWHHVVFTRTQATGAMTLYVDGASTGTATGHLNALTSTTTMNIGRSTSATNYFAGTIDEIATYNVALSGSTVSVHYASAQ